MRKVDELPWQLLEVAQLGGNDPTSPHWDAVADLFTNLHFLEAKAESGQVFELADDFAAGVNGLPEGKKQRMLELLEEALRRDLHFLARHPSSLFQCLWNSAYWYDCPEAARYYVDGKAPGQEAGLGLHELLGRWHQEKGRRAPGFAWLRCRRPPEPHLGTPLKMILRGHEHVASGVSF